MEKENSKFKKGVDLVWDGHPRLFMPNDQNQVRKPEKKSDQGEGKIEIPYAYSCGLHVEWALQAIPVRRTLHDKHCDDQC